MPGPSKLFSILVISDYRSVASSRPEAEIFVRLAQQGHTVHILSYPDAHEYNQRCRSYGITVIEKPPHRKISSAYIRFLRDLVQQHQYDVVHAFNSKGLTNAVWALRGQKTKLIAYRGYAGQTHWYDPMMYLKYFHPRVDHIICVSKDIEVILSRNMAWAKNKLSTIPKGHDPAWYNGIAPIDRTSIHCSAQDILVCFLANLRPFKGLTYLLQSTHLLPPGLPLQFIFIGHGYDAPAIQQKLQHSPYKNHFHLLGFRPDAQSVLAACDSLVQVSTHGEGLSKSVVEAMFLGIAPIITAIPGNEGLAENGQSGWVIPPKHPQAIATALMEMASDAEERKRRGGQAKAHMERYFHIDHTMAQYVALYDRLTRGK